MVSEHDHNNNSPSASVQIDIDGTLDLHSFRPGDIGTLVPEYLHECCRKNILAVRIIHGKGNGSLRRGVHAILKRSTIVKKFYLADETGGGWGATCVELKTP